MTDGMNICFAEDPYILGKAVMKDGTQLEIISVSEEKIHRDGDILSKSYHFMLSNASSYRYREWYIGNKKQYTFDILVRNLVGSKEYYHTNDIREIEIRV